MYGGLAFQSGAGEQVRKEGVFTLYTEPCCQAAIDACMHGIFSPTSLSDTENDQFIYPRGARLLHALACQRRSVPITEACQRASLVFPSPRSFIVVKKRLKDINQPGKITAQQSDSLSEAVARRAYNPAPIKLTTVKWARPNSTTPNKLKQPEIAFKKDNNQFGQLI
jgi:hypothetical protein